MFARCKVSWPSSLLLSVLSVLSVCCVGLSVCSVVIDFDWVEEEVSTHRGTGILLLLVSPVLCRRTYTLTVTFDIRSQSADAGLCKEMVGGVRDRQEDDRNAAGLRDLRARMRQIRRMSGEERLTPAMGGAGEQCLEILMACSPNEEGA